MNRKELYEYAKEGLEKRAQCLGVDIKKYYSPSTNKSYLEIFCENAQDRQVMGNIINYFRNPEVRECLSHVLCEFDAQEVVKKYKSADEIINAINDYNSTIIKQKDNHVKNWKVYINGIYQCAELLTNNKSDIEDLISKPTNYNERKEKIFSKEKLSLHKLCDLHGVGMAVACNWLKECGAEWLAKPDLHIKRVVGTLLEKEIKDEEKIKSIKNSESDKTVIADKTIKVYMEENKNEKDLLDIQKKLGRKKMSVEEYTILYMYKWAKELKITPYKLDRIIYLYCTNGNFYLDDNEISEDDLLKKIQ